MALSAVKKKCYTNEPALNSGFIFCRALQNLCPVPHFSGRSLSYSLLQDAFFYSLVYDPTQKTLLADKGEIRVGPRFQADVPDMLQEGDQNALSLTHPVCDFISVVFAWF